MILVATPEIDIGQPGEASKAVRWSPGAGREAGYRASVAASFVEAAGRQAVAIDDAFGKAQQAGLSVTVPDAA